MLEKSFLNNNNIYEIGVDEVGRGPLFGRVYTGAVVLPNNNDNDFKFELMKDSKKFYSEKKIQEVANYIKEHALFWSVTYSTEEDIDKYNILQATYMSMHKSIKNILHYSNNNNNNIKLNNENVFLLIDGSYFKDFTYFDNKNENFVSFNHKCITCGDNKYASIAAASILAKVERDKYVKELCVQYPELITNYKIDSNKGYGAKVHLDGIKKHGITPFHRKTFGICKQYS
jgi:ribonuclease HII